MLSKSQQAKYFGGTLDAICELMRSSGISEYVAREQFELAIARAFAVQVPKKLREAPAISRCADVCTRWHLEKRYINRAGEPRPLTWNGRTGTLLGLAKIAVGREAAEQTINELITRRLLRKLPTGSWIPKSKVVAPSALDHSQILRASAMIGRLLRTVAYNTSIKYRGDVLFEVTAQVPRLPTRNLPAFKRFSKAQGLIFAKTVDDWLESRNLRTTKGKNVRSHEAGIIAFAYHEPSYR